MSACLCVPDCKICSAVHKDVTLFLTGTTEEYAQEVAQYRNEPVILENAKSLKECIDGKMTEDDKKNAVNVLVGPALCVHAAGACLGVCSGQGTWGRWSPFFFSTTALLHHAPWGSRENGVGKTQPSPGAAQYCPATSLGVCRPSCVLGITWPRCQALSSGLSDSSLASW